jgi:hypothetical protein
VIEMFSVFLLPFSIQKHVKNKKIVMNSIYEVVPANVMFVGFDSVNELTSPIDLP